MKFEKLLKAQKLFFNSDKTKNVDFRIEQLRKLKSIIKLNEELLYSAIKLDLGKSKYETYSTELSIIYSEIKFAIRNLKNWSSPKLVKTNLVNFPGKSFIYPEPLGNTLIIGAWNYPIQLAIVPAISSISAGNTVILKPSEIATNVSRTISKIINKNFNKEFFTVIEGDVQTSTQLLKLKFDKIFFTGSTATGRIVYEAAAKNLTPVTLELGGKSPAIVLSDANLKIAAKRIAWGKFLNSGQTCIAPDYVLVDEKIENKFLNLLKSEIDKVISLDDYPKIINESKFERLTKLIDRNKIFYGGEVNKNKLFIAPTILTNISSKDKIMKEEIFGPILPVMKFKNINDEIAKLKNTDKPLSLYLFTKNKILADKIFKTISFGGGALNDTIMHVANSNLPFGGVGKSGIGSYHGEFGFNNFSHFKSIVQKPTWFDPFIKYPPFTKLKFWILKKVLN